jgi:hypothetical protein
MDDQDFDDFDCDQVEEEKNEVYDKVQTINDESVTNQKDNFREYHKRPEVIEKARLCHVQSKQHKTLLPATVDEVSYAASYFLNIDSKFCNRRILKMTAMPTLKTTVLSTERKGRLILLKEKLS